MNTNIYNSLISTPTNCTGNRRESFLFVFLCSPLGCTPFATLRDAIESHWLSSCACTCRNVAAGWDGLVI